MKLGDPTPKPSPRCEARLIWPTSGYKQKKPYIQRWTRNPAQQPMLAFRDYSKEQLLRQCGTLPVFQQECVWIKVWFCKKPPDKMFINKDRNRPKGDLQHASGKNPITTAMKPDTDNCLKFILDALSTVAWKDDLQVTKISAVKCYDYEPPYQGRTIVEFGPVLEVDSIPQWTKLNQKE